MKLRMVPLLAAASAAGISFAAGWYCKPAGKVSPGTGPPPLVQEKTPAAKKPDTTASAARSGDVKTLRRLLKEERNPARAAARILSALDGLDLPALTQMAANLASTGNEYDRDSWQLQQLIFGRLAEIDPAQAMQTALAVKSTYLRSGAISAVIQATAATDPEGAEHMVAQMPGGWLRRSALSSLAEVMARTDGPAAMQMLERQRVARGDWSAWGTLFRSWTDHDPRAAAAALSSLPPQTARNAVDDVAAQWARNDPDAALAWVDTLKDSPLHRDALRSTVAVIAQQDPEKAQALAASCPAGDRRLVLQSVASAMAESDSKSALSWAGGLTDPLERQRCLATIASSCGYRDTDAARSALELMPAGTMRTQTFENVLGWMSYMDPNAAKSWADTLKGDEKTRALQEVAYYFAVENPDAGSQLLADLPERRGTSEAWGRIASLKADKDPATALTWAGSLDSEPNRLRAVTGIFSNWSQRSPQAAAAALAGMTNANERREAAGIVAGNWANRSPVEAEQWAQSLKGDDRLAALAAVWQNTADDDPQHAAASLAAAAGDASSSPGAADKISASAANIASLWTGESPSGAATWAGTLPQGKVREEAYGGIAAAWARFDPEAASAWIDTLPRDRSRDVAIGKLVSQISTSDPASALRWASSVENSGPQFEALKTAVIAWKEINPEAARAAVQSATLPEDMRARVMDVIR
ncbi:MAG TPA: hypothetical protein VHM91_00285 [Verrucomicrobiales bacterium]|nr:hypothetical protein [Verrucomicrobiales bacterium]